jgi:hypothetical protein
VRAPRMRIASISFMVKVFQRLTCYYNALPLSVRWPLHRKRWDHAHRMVNNLLSFYEYPSSPFR